MAFILEDLVVDRVDFVDEGCNSASFIELYKRKEQSKMSIEEILSKMVPEHAAVIEEALAKAKEELNTATEELAKANESLAEVSKECSEAKEQLDKANEDLEETKSELETMKATNNNAAAFDETETFKSMPQEVRDMFETMKAQKEAAEAEIRKAKEEAENAEAIAKAKEFKAIPVEQSKLVNIIKGASADLIDMLTVVNAAIEGTVLDEVGKSNPKGTGADAWTKIEAKADELVKADTSISKAKAISQIIKDNPELYKEYLQGGAN